MMSNSTAREPAHPRRPWARRVLLASSALAAGVAFWHVTPPLAAAPRTTALSGSSVQSVFFIAKSENRNQVHYAVRVDARCRPEGDRPVYGYWRDFEDGPNVTSRLRDREQRAYGLKRPTFVRRAESGGRIGVALRAVPDRPLTIETFAVQGQCRARALTTISRAPAVLRSIYVELGFLFSIDYILLRGYRVTDGKPVQEKIDD
jgi:hypothetical protein